MKTACNLPQQIGLEVSYEISVEESDFFVCQLARFLMIAISQDLGKLGWLS